MVRSEERILVRLDLTVELIAVALKLRSWQSFCSHVVWRQHVTCVGLEDTSVDHLHRETLFSEDWFLELTLDIGFVRGCWFESHL